MCMQNDEAGCVFAVLLLIGVASVLWWTYDSGRELGHTEERKAAVKAGVARYVADPATGATRFEYLRPGEGKP